MLDMLVVGGGINGVGIARDAAGRGLRVALCEQHDLASHTSSASSKLVHGGLRYLEQGHFGMVRQSLAERATLLRIAPHLVRPLSFVLPHEPHLRPAWIIRSGLLLYDVLAGRAAGRLRSRGLALHGHPLGKPLQHDRRRGFTYADAQVPDARLVVLTAMDAAERGARIWTRTACVQAWRDPDGWWIDLRDAQGRFRSVRTRMLVNATGAWAPRFTTDISLTRCTPMRLVQGSHIVVPALYEHDHAYVLQQPDGRIVFVIPFEGSFSLVGTTDVDFSGALAAPMIDDAQRDYLCAAVNRSFRQQIAPSDIVWSFSGVRALLDDTHGAPSEASRDYRLDLDTDGAPLLNVLGGKLTTYRRLAEKAVDLLLRGDIAGPAAWTADGAVLPGGELGPAPEVETWLRGRWPWLPHSLAMRWARSYGSRAARIIGAAGSLGDLGEHFGAGLYQAEAEYLFRHEWVVQPEDLLWRRSMLGLRLGRQQQQRLAQWMAERPATPAMDIESTDDLA